MQWSTERILTTHAGSLPRPESLTRLFAERVAGRPIDEAALEREIEAATLAVVPRQAAAGIDVVGNGEQGRESFFLYVQRRMTGFGGRGRRRLWQDGVRYPGFVAMRNQAMAGRAWVSQLEPPKVIGPVAYADPETIHAECRQFRRVLEQTAAPHVEAFICAPSPGMVASAIPNEHYDSEEAYVNALADALRVEYQAVVGHGFVLQLDCPDLAMERHITYQDRPVGDFVAFVERIVAAINRAIAGLPPERVRLHVCWGNYEGPHDCDVPLADIVGPILEARVGGFLMPFANPRHAHESRVFATSRLRDDQVLAVGCIDTTTNYIEHPEVVAERLEKAARAVGDPRRILAATDCGFDTSAGMGRVAEDVVWAKLRALSDGARLASERLLGRG
ncbi:MAG: cobalamin-independent methionine synthase II family protein [Alphaproteobacteria bacterium]|nr:cobalamin-independent methionine synthase II family protein [Alphaproteobacteria bacterium]